MVAHQAVLRALYAFLKDIDPEQCPTLEVRVRCEVSALIAQLHEVVKLTPKTYTCEEERIFLGP